MLKIGIVLGVCWIIVIVGLFALSAGQQTVAPAVQNTQSHIDQPDASLDATRGLDGGANQVQSP